MAGKTKNQHLRALQEEYLHRQQFFRRARIVETADILSAIQLSLPRLTFWHELTRVVLLERVYRAMNLIRGYSYPK